VSTKPYPWRQRPIRTREPQQQPFRMHEDGLGYDTLRPTKGWLRVSASRLRARAALTMMSNRVLQRKLGALIQA
jgi:hypothetical protein